MRQQILELMKQQLHTISDGITYVNYKDMEQQIYRVLTIIESAETMLDTPVHPLSVSDLEEQTVKYPPLIAQILATPDVKKIEETPIQESIKEEIEIPAVSDEDIHRFERRIKGGVVPSLEAFVPEKIIHELDLCHGDLVKAKFLFKPDNGPARYEYEIVERATGPKSPDNIVEIDMAVVSYEPRCGGLALAKTVSADEIEYEGEHLVLAITDEDIEMMDLRVGDIVNAAFYANNPNYMKVRWKYSTNEYQSEQSTPKHNASYYKKNDSVKEELEQVFENKVIGAMGYVPGQAAYREEVESRGGTFVGLTGREGDVSLAGSIRKLDALVMVLGHVGHTGTKWAVPFCKENKIPFTSIKTFGRSAFVDAAANLLGR